MNSWPFLCLCRVINPGRFFQAGYVAKVPVCPPMQSKHYATISSLALRAAGLKRWYCSHDETSRHFVKPLLASQGLHNGCDVDGAHATLNKVNEEYESLQEQIDACVSDDLSLSEIDKERLELRFGYREAMPLWFDTGKRPDDTELVSAFVSFLVGVAFGRWSIAMTNKEIPMRFEPPELLNEPAAESGEPLEDGILVMSEAKDHPCDVISRVSALFEGAFGIVSDDAIERCRLAIGADSLLDYFRKPGKGGFWDDHVSRYSRSRRKAPIYWLLQSSKKNYALWLYYHRLDKDLLFKALVNYVEPKIRLEASGLESLRSQKTSAGESGKEAKRLAKDVERQEEFLSELRDFEDKLRRAANLHLEPDLNDGVVLNIAPLWELVPWKEAKKYWDELMDGQYEWSSIGQQLREKGLVKC